MSMHNIGISILIQCVIIRCSADRVESNSDRLICERASQSDGHHAAAAAALCTHDLGAAQLGLGAQPLVERLQRVHCFDDHALVVKSERDFIHRSRHD